MQGPRKRSLVLVQMSRYWAEVGLAKSLRLPQDRGGTRLDEVENSLVPLPPLPWGVRCSSLDSEGTEGHQHISVKYPALPFSHYTEALTGCGRNRDTVSFASRCVR